MSITRIFDIPRHQLTNFPRTDCLAGKENGQWIFTSTREYVDGANEISCGLLALGIGIGDKVANISANRPEWNIVDIGILQAGAVHVPMYPTISEADYKFILNDAEVKIVFVADEDLYKKVQSIRSEVPSLQEIYTYNNVQGARHWSEVKELGKKNFDLPKLEAIEASIKETDLATLIYTSGTTGNPKGVMLSHRNVISNVLACRKVTPFDHTHKALSFLPLCHIYERTLTYIDQYIGAGIYYAESMEKIADNIREVKPDGFSTVPRLLEKVYDKILEKGKALTGVKKKLFFWALDLGLRYEPNGANGWWYELQLSIANALVFKKWREALGGNVKVVVSGSAALQPRLAKVFTAAKIPILEGYGLTETSPVISVNRLDKGESRIGTVGPVIEGVEVKIAEDREILCKGPNIMMGYYKRPDLTAEVIDKDGWFHTGDIGTFVDGKFLKITDRKKEVFKTSGGKYIAPQPMENKFKESPFIEQVMVIGEYRNFPAALIVPAFPYLMQWCETKKIKAATNEEIAKSRQVAERIGQEIAFYNQGFGQWEQVKKFELLSSEWTIASGELTPTMKPKRKIILERYKDIVEGIYNGKGYSVNEKQ